MKYICFSKSKEEFNYLNESLGMGDDRAVYFVKAIGRHRLYRNSYPEPKQIGDHLELLTFNDLQSCQQACDRTNEVNKDDFTPLAID